MSTNVLYPRLVDDLNELRRQWRTAKLLEGGLLVLAGVAGVLVVLVAADNVLKLETAGRFLLALVLWGTLAVAVLSLVVRRWLEDRRDDFFAAMVEQSHPELRNRLINALQLGRGTDYGSPRIIAAIVADAAHAAAEVDMADCLDWKPVKRALIAAAAALVLMTGYAIAFSPWFANGLSRMLLPMLNISPYTATVVVADSVEPRDGARFPEGMAVPIVARVKGVIPREATLFRRSAGSTWQPALMQADSRQEGMFRSTVADASEGFEFYIAAGDGRSRAHAVEVVRRPRIETIAVRYVSPEYTGRPPLEVSESNGEIAGLVGTAVRLELKSTKPLHEAALETEDGEVIALASDGDNRTWSSSFTLWSDAAKAASGANGRLLKAPTRYKVRLIDSDGYENAEPLWRSITLVTDQHPTVAITAPGRDVQVKPDETVALAIESRDDYGLGEVRVLYRVNDESTVHELRRFPQEGAPVLKSSDTFAWDLASSGFQSGDLVQYWAEAVDRNVITGPGRGESRRYSIFLITPEQVLAKLEILMDDYAAVLEELIRLQRENRAQTASGGAFETLIVRQTKIRTNTALLARAMQKGALPVATMVQSLEELYAGLMADCIRLLESGRDAGDAAKASANRNDSLPVQDAIIERLQELLARLQRNEQARKELRRIEKKDKTEHQWVTKALTNLIDDLDRMLADESELAAKLEKMPKRAVDEYSEEELQALKEFDELHAKWAKWAKGTVDELAKLPTGFVDDFGLREDVNRVFEEIEKSASRPQASKLEVALEDLGSSKATEMLEDLETWMPDAPDALKWVQEEPLDKKPMAMPEMPLPDALEDLIGELLQEADEFDEEADDVTSAWGDNLNQAGWGVADGPISNFSAKGKTGNDLPNNHEVTGRAGDGRRGKSSGQMVGDTSRALEGRKTPARLNNERYEPGRLKQEGQDDPNGATGGGKKAGAGRRGLQGGTPPDFVRDIERLSAKQAGVREKAEQVARKLDTSSVSGRRLSRSIELMKSAEGDLRDLRYEDAARKRRVALEQLKSAFNVDQTTAVQLHRARELPPQLRQELLQSADEGYPKGYESLVESYFRALSEAEK